jgi:hypothetical protein
MHRLLLLVPLFLLMGSEPPNVPAPPGSRDIASPDLKDDGKALPNAPKMERLAENDPLKFLEECLIRYKREVKGFTCIFQKQELIGDKLYPVEIIDVAFRDNPHSVYMAWQQGTRRAERVLYVAGEHGNKLLIRPAGKLARAVAGASGRYTLPQFGLRKAMERVLVEWEAASKDGDLGVKYLGIKKVKEAGDRPCYVLRRVAKKPDRDGIQECTIYVDTQNWLQVGTILKDEKGNLLAEYYWRDIKLNPEFRKNQFTRAGLNPDNDPK